ncbi:MAG: protein TolA [Gammaproteobacteria bacterium]|jgi:colicin import membrane protein|nr:protein TolA [Gammaproteobacteria bacterium]
MQLSFPQTQYRWPVALAVLLHVLIAVFLFGSIFFYRPSQYAVEQQAVQATIVTSSQLAAMTQANTKLAAKPVEKPAPKPVEKPLPKPVEKPVPKVIEKPVPAKPIPQKTAPTKVVQKTNPKVAQKSLEESLLQEDLSAAATPKTPSKNTAKALQQSLMDQQLEADEGQVKTARSQAVQGEVDKYKAMILQQIQQNWIVPQNVQNLSCVLQVQVAPGGMVTGVSLVKSSGNEALDRSAIAAVNKASPLPVPKDSAAFAAFRVFTLTVRPEGSDLAAN